ncbi:MAG: ARPP-1 family domain-containing protein [Candidatus Heimdallarchaeota archaeon]
MLDQLEIGAPEIAEGVAVLPLRLPGDAIEMQTLSQAVEQGIVEVLESESVNVLRVGYSTPTPIPVLIPYLQVVTGGKQDRMITAPIILSPAKAEKEVRDIAVNCVEQGRWTFSRGGEETSSRFQVDQNVRMSPSMGYANVGASQAATWGSIRKYRAAKAEVVPTEAASSQSFAEMEEIAQKVEEEREEINNSIKSVLSKGMELIPEQNGIALFIGKELIGMELYGSSKLWQGQKEAVKNSFVSELSLREIKDEPIQAEEYEKIVRAALDNLALEEAGTIDLGQLFVSKPGKDRDHSALLMEHENKLAEFYYAKGQAHFVPTESEEQDAIQIQENVQRMISPEEAVSQVQRQEIPDKDLEEK